MPDLGADVFHEAPGTTVEEVDASFCHLRTMECGSKPVGFFPHGILIANNPWDDIFRLRPGAQEDLQLPEASFIGRAWREFFLEGLRSYDGDGQQRVQEGAFVLEILETLQQLSEFFPNWRVLFKEALINFQHSGLLPPLLRPKLGVLSSPGRMLYNPFYMPHNPEKSQNLPQEPGSHETLPYGGDKANWEATSVIAGLPLSPKVIAYALLKEGGLEDYQPEGGETGFVDKVKFKNSGKRTPTLRLAMEKPDQKTKNGHDVKKAPVITKEQEAAREKLNAFIRQEGESWKDIKRTESGRLGRSKSILKTLELDKAFLVEEMSAVAQKFMEFGDQYVGRLKQGADQLFSTICRREGVDDELITKAWAMALNKRSEAQPKSKKSGSIRSA